MLSHHGKCHLPGQVARLGKKEAPVTAWLVQISRDETHPLLTRMSSTVALHLIVQNSQARNLSATATNRRILGLLSAQLSVCEWMWLTVLPGHSIRF